MSIERILSALGPAQAPGLVQPATASAGEGFGNTLERLVSAVESSGAESNQAVMAMTDGTGDVHDAMIALQRADLTLQLTMQIRNKFIGAYQEIMRMPV